MSPVSRASRPCRVQNSSVHRVARNQRPTPSPVTRASCPCRGRDRLNPRPPEPTPSRPCRARLARAAAEPAGEGPYTPVALITGASRGIGRAAAVALAKAGYRLALLGRTPADLIETARLAGVPDALDLQADVADPDQVPHAIDQTATHFGRLDVLVNVAGLTPVRSIEAMSVDEWRAVIDTNLSAVQVFRRSSFLMAK